MSSHPTIRLILSDIDNTILPRGAERVSPRTVAAFRAAIGAGLLVGPSTGRGISWIPPFFGGDAACCATAVATNGLQIYLGGEKVLEKTLDPEALEHLRALVAEVPHAGLIVFDGGTPLLVEGSRDDLRVAFPAYGEACVPVDRLPDKPVIKCNVFSNLDEPQMAELVRMLNAEVPELDIDRALPNSSNVMKHGWNKGAAVRWLCDRLGIGLDEVVVFGDADNDLPMFHAVPNAVAVANATRPAAEAARWHIGACADDAVAGAIEALARGEWPFER